MGIRVVGNAMLEEVALVAFALQWSIRFVQFQSGLLCVRDFFHSSPIGKSIWMHFLFLCERMLVAHDQIRSCFLFFVFVARSCCAWYSVVELSFFSPLGRHLARVFIQTFLTAPGCVGGLRGSILFCVAMRAIYLARVEQYCHFECLLLASKSYCCEVYYLELPA